MIELFVSQAGRDTEALAGGHRFTSSVSMNLGIDNFTGADNVGSSTDKDQAKQHQPSLGPIEGDNEDETGSPVHIPSNRASPMRSKPLKLDSPKKNFIRSHSPGSKQSSVTAGSHSPLQEGQPSAPNRGIIHSETNPEFIPDTSRAKKNPFFETMPGPEVWHRRMPPYFTFGETPFMERDMSRQINEDLSGGKFTANITYPYKCLLLNVGKDQTESKQYC